MPERIIDHELRLIPYYRNDAVSLPWYQDPDVCKQVDNRDTPYDTALLHSMYDYLCANDDCYYIGRTRRSPSSSARNTRTTISAAAASRKC